MSRGRAVTAVGVGLLAISSLSAGPDGESARAAVRDRYELAGGCYAVRAVGRGYVARSAEGFVANAKVKAEAEPFRFRAFDLGKYLLFASQTDFLAAASTLGDDGARPATDVAQAYVRGTGDESLNPVRAPVLAAVDSIEGGADTAGAPLRARAAGDGVVAATLPSAAAEWVVAPLGGNTFALQRAVDDHDIAAPGPWPATIAATLNTAADGRLVLTSGNATSGASRFAFETTRGCAQWPEIELNVSGPHAVGRTPYEETRGYFDAHLHMMAFEFLGGRARCGRPWHPYGVTYALLDCPDHAAGGRGAVLEMALSGGDPVQGHDTVGWPTFGYWPRYGSLTHEQVYYRWLERAWRGGLRMFTNLLVDNGVLCELYPLKRNSCNEMDGVRLQAQRLRELERYIDAQSGGPGRGWFRIVTDPFQARRVINAGKLAVVMGIEVSVPFDCGERLGTPRCTKADIDARLDEVYALGVRQMELTNKFDNALTGVTGDGGALGVLVNSGNKYETGHNWQMQTCDEPRNHAEHAHDKTQYNIADESGGNIGRDAIFGAVLKMTGASGAAPVYPTSPHCNVIGLTDLGRHAISGLIRRGMVFDPDHMSAIARDQALDHVAAARYSGLVSSHSWADDPTYRRILKLGGVVTPHAGGSTGFVAKWRQLRKWSDPRYLFGVGFGSDMNGFSTQGSPRMPDEGHDVDYPFTGLGGVRVGRQVSGTQTYDINTDGVDHFGLYPDWVEDARIVAGRDGAAFVQSMTRGAEGYLQMWERAVGIRPNSCRADVADLTNANLDRLRRSMTPEQVLRTLGQPDVRAGSRFTYCAARGRRTVNFGSDGRFTRLTPA